jgi:hypothetical protein
MPNAHLIIYMVRYIFILTNIQSRVASRKQEAETRFRSTANTGSRRRRWHALPVSRKQGAIANLLPGKHPH